MKVLTAIAAIAALATSVVANGNIAACYEADGDGGCDPETWYIPPKNCDGGCVSGDWQSMKALDTDYGYACKFEAYALSLALYIRTESPCPSHGVHRQVLQL